MDYTHFDATCIWYTSQFEDFWEGVYVSPTRHQNYHAFEWWLYFFNSRKNCSSQHISVLFIEVEWISTIFFWVKNKQLTQKITEYSQTYGALRNKNLLLTFLGKNLILQNPTNILRLELDFLHTLGNENVIYHLSCQSFPRVWWYFVM